MCVCTQALIFVSLTVFKRNNERIASSRWTQISCRVIHHMSSSQQIFHKIQLVMDTVSCKGLSFLYFMYVNYFQYVNYWVCICLTENTCQECLASVLYSREASWVFYFPLKCHFSPFSHWFACILFCILFCSCVLFMKQYPSVFIDNWVHVNFPL